MPEEVKSAKVSLALTKFDQKMTELRQARLDWMKRVVARVEAKKLAEVEEKLRNQQ